MVPRPRLGITRLNAYAGIASGVLIRDTFEAGLINQGLPNYIEAGGNEIPLVIQDKIFVGPDISSKDPTWSGIVQTAATRPGSLWYAHTYEPNQHGTGRWELAPGGLPLPDPSCIPEFFGDTMLVNGTTFPQATVEARRYRLRLLNACNARFLNLQLYVDDGSPNGITLDAERRPDQHTVRERCHRRLILAADRHRGGLPGKPGKGPEQCPDPVVIRPSRTGHPVSIQRSLLVAPAERPDVIVDFSGYAGEERHPLQRRARPRSHAGTTVTTTSRA